jgi:hypothetical protein
MTFTVSPTLDDVYTAVKAFLMAVLPLDNEHVAKNVQNRTAMPSGPFAMMYIATAARLRTNQDTYDPSDPDPAGITREQGVELEMQLDLYGPASGDWAAIVSTLWRDDYGCVALAPNCQPLHADEPVRGPLVTGEEQYLDKWILRAHLQYNPTVSTIDQFASIVSIDVINVDEKYPP